MEKNKNQSSKDKGKFKGSKGRKQTHENNKEIPILRYGASTNLHVWKDRISVEATLKYGNLAQLLEDDAYYEPDMSAPVYQLPPDDSSSINMDSGTSNSEPVVGPNTRKSSQRRELGASSSSTNVSSVDDLTQEMMKLCWMETVKGAMKEKSTMRSNRPNFYAFMLKYLSRESLDAVKKDEEYPTFSKIKDPLGMWLAIKRTHKIGSDSGVGVIKKADARMKYSNAKQGTYESITAFKERFDYLLDAYETAGNQKLQDEDIATDYLRALDDARYRELKLNIENDELMGYNKIPKMLSQMHALACNFKVFKKQSVTNHGTAFATRDQKKNGSDDDHGDNSNDRNEKSKGQDDSSSGKNQDSKKGKRRPLICFGCGEPGHKVTDCPQNNGDDVEKRSSTVYCTRELTVGYSLFADVARPFAWYECLLDSQSNCSIMDERLLTNVHNDGVQHHISGMGPTKLVLTKVGDLDGFFECIAGRNLKANILCQSDVEDMYQITYDQGVSYTIHLPEDRKLVFHRINKHYVADMRDWAESDKYVMITTAAENESKFKKKEVARAKEVRDLLRNYGYPSQEEAIKLITDGNVTRIPYTVQDVKNSYEIYGPPAEFVRGKRTAHKVKRQEIDVSIKEIHCKTQTMYGDIMYVKKKMFLISLSEPLGLLMTTPVSTTTSEALGFALQEQINYLRSGGFAPRAAYLDDQPGFAALVGHIPGVQVDIAGAGDHMDKIDAKIRRLKEMIRSIYTGLPWKLPDMMIKDLVKYAVSRMNLKKSSSNGEVESPRVAFTGRKPNYVKELSIGFGDYCEVYRNNVTSNDVTQARTVPCIALRPAGNATGSWWMLNMKTKMRLRTSNWTKLVTTDTIVQVINAMSGDDCNSGTFELFEEYDPDEDAQPEHEKSISGRGEAPEPDSDAVQEVVSMEDEHVMNSGQSEVVDGESMSPDDEVDELDHDDDQVLHNAVLQNDVTDGVSQDVTDVVDETSVTDAVLVTHDVNHCQGTVRAMESFCFTNMSVKRSLQEYGNDAYSAIVKELVQLLHDKKAMHPVRRADLSSDDLKRAIRSHMFLKAKFDATGKFEKIKARLVANGAQQDRKLYEDVSSPTVKLESVMILLVIAAREKMVVTAVDIGGAYLNAVMRDDILMDMDPLLTQLLCKVAPEVKPFVSEKGKLLMKLDKALYGCIQSAKLWYETLTEFLRSIGFKHNEVDSCVMMRREQRNCVLIAIFVDDILICATSMSAVNRLVSELKTQFLEIKLSKPGNFSYLGMHIVVKGGKINVSMAAYVEGLLKEYRVVGSVTSPATGDLFKEGDEGLLSATCARTFHTIVAKLLYLSKRARPDILIAVAYLTTRVKSPTAGDMTKLNRVLKYLNGSVNRCLILNPHGPLVVIGYIDAAFGLHSDGKSHTGMVISVAGATVMCKSSKQRIVTRDSTESELVGASDRVSDVLQCDEFVKSLKFETEVPIVMQDNDSTIVLLKGGKGKYRTKHLKVRQAHFKELIDSGVIRVEYMSTKLMLADPLSKPLQGTLFRYLTSSVFGEQRQMPQGRVGRYPSPDAK